MKRIKTRAHALCKAARRPRTTTNAAGGESPTPAEDFLVAVDLGRHADGERPATAYFSLGELLECDTMDALLERAAQKTGPTRPNPDDFRDRPIIDYLKALGVPEDTSRYEKERGVTTVNVRLGVLPREPR